MDKRQGATGVLRTRFEEIRCGFGDFAFEIERCLLRFGGIGDGIFEDERSLLIGFQSDFAIAGQEFVCIRRCLANAEQNAFVVRGGSGLWIAVFALCLVVLHDCSIGARLGQIADMGLGGIECRIERLFRRLDCRLDIFGTLARKRKDEIVDLLAPARDIFVFDAHEVFRQRLRSRANFSRQRRDKRKSDADDRCQKEQIGYDNCKSARYPPLLDVYAVHPRHEWIDEIDDDERYHKRLHDLVKYRNENEQDQRRCD